MKFEFEVIEEDLADRKKIIEMKEEIRARIESLSKFGQNTMSDALVRMQQDLEYAETEWLIYQRSKLANKLSEVLNVDRNRLNERFWRED